MDFTNVEVIPVFEKDKNLRVRKWFSGDASLQRAETEKQDDERIFAVYVEDKNSSAFCAGFAVGKEGRG